MSETVYANLIDNRPVAAASGKTVPVVEPATGQPYAAVPESDATDIDAAVESASRAFPAWAATPVAERAQLLNRLADLIDANLDRLALAESRDTGKPVSLARAVDIPRSAANLRYFAGAVQHTPGEFHAFDGGGVPGGMAAINYTLRSPRGVAGCISPWNLPLYLFTWKIAPALATGNTVVGKPSEVTPVTAALLGELAVEAGLPPGALNIVHGTGAGAGAALVKHPRVPTVTFTGSTPVGRWIGQTCGETLKRVSLELGGKNPFIVFDDADIDAAIDTAARAAFTNQGQVCLCGSRLLVHRSVRDRVVEGLVAKATSLRIGDPSDAGTQFGALTSKAHFEKVSSYVQAARELGGRIHCGGEPVTPDALPERCRGGFFYQPTVVSGLACDCRVEQEEIFGPVVTVQTFEDEAGALKLANNTPYGLAATIFTRDLARAHRVAAAVESGIVWVNCWMVRDLRTPFGGVKQSGVGREGGSDAIRFFTEPKNVCVRMEP
ncbi:MAG TPA: aldehyde dehydrogenase [Phycisphaerales bacterium]|nr:aldehyde dehydrogenase [Phycisphaerales bacterium]